MSMISLGEAAFRFGLSPEAIEEWAKKGLLHVHDVVVKEQRVDEEELAQVAESLGWLRLSAENWDDDNMT